MPQAGAAARLQVLVVLAVLAAPAVLALLALLAVAGVGQRAGDGSRGVAGAIIGHEKAQGGDIHCRQRSDPCRDQLSFVVAEITTVMPRPGVLGGSANQAADGKAKLSTKFKRIAIMAQFSQLHSKLDQSCNTSQLWLKHPWHPFVT